MKEPNLIEDIAPGRPCGAELRDMALRQQQQIETQHQLLAAKEQRLRFLKAQEVRSEAAAAEGERLRRLRERVEAQESKLRRLRALRGQVDLQKTYNVTLSNDLDSIRALFSEKEKELSLAVAKVEALTRQLEELRRDRRGPLNLISDNATSDGHNGQTNASPAALELEKLRRELMYRNQLSLQQDARLHLQREALQQRQAELRSVDQRILELQSRLLKKKTSNLLLQSSSDATSTPQLPIHSQNIILNNNIALQLLSNSAPIKPSNSVYPSQRVITRSNVAAVEPYMHTPHKSTQKSGPQKQQLAEDLALMKLNVHHTATVKSSENDDGKHDHQHKIYFNADAKDTENAEKNDSKYQTLPYNVKYGLSKSASSGSVPYHTAAAAVVASSVLSSRNGITNTNTNESDSEKAATAADSDSSATSKKHNHRHQPLSMATVQSKLHGKSVTMSSVSATVTTAISATSIAASSMSSPLYLVQQSNNNLFNNKTTGDDKPAIKPKAKHQIPSGNLVVPPRKPISSVAPTTISLASAAKVVAHSPKVHIVAPNINTAPIVSTTEFDHLRPLLPPKPGKNGTTDTGRGNANVSSVPTVVSVINKPPLSEPVSSENQSPTSFLPNTDSLPIKARPLTIKKQPLSEQPPRLRSTNTTNGVKPIQYASRRIEMPPAFLFPEMDRANTNGQSVKNDNAGSVDEADKAIVAMVDVEINNQTNSNHQYQQPPHHLDVVRRTRSVLNEIGKAKLARRVSFDPLALLLDASLEGELELVKKTTMQVPNPSAANDEGITALHNAICAGHFSIVKFLVEYGCDVNAQDSDGWTPLHCAASCNNLEMVKFLVESGACLFATTLSDHETPAEKCEEDEEGFDGCSEYLYSIQEKLGILNGGEVSAVFSYDSQQPDELSFDVNDKMTILRKGDDSEREWWWARLENGKEGYVPRNLFGLYPRVPLQQQHDE